MDAPPAPEDPTPAARPAKAATKTPAKTAAKAAAPVQVPAEVAAPEVVAQAAPAAKAPAKAPVKAPAKTAARATKAPAAKVLAPVDPADVWSDSELAEVRGELAGQAKELRGEIDDAEAAANDLQQNAVGEGPGDEADAGSKTFEREHEMSLANNSRDLLQQVERALARVDDGTYGRCESCGNAIPKPRLQAFPRATLCVSCKQREERR